MPIASNLAVMTWLTLHISQQRPPLIGWALCPYPVYIILQMEQVWIFSLGSGSLTGSFGPNSRSSNDDTIASLILIFSNG